MVDRSRSRYLYYYRAVITDVYDGDTVTADIDLGFNTWLRGVKIRLYGINAPELRGKEKEKGIIARDWLRSKIKDRPVLIQSHMDRRGKYGRILAVIWAKGPRKDQFTFNINETIVRKGMAVKKDYDR